MKRKYEVSIQLSLETVRAGHKISAIDAENIVRLALNSLYEEGYYNPDIIISDFDHITAKEVKK